MAGEFVDGWLVAQVLGEGSYGEVRLLVNARTGASVALKTVRAEGAEGARAAAREAALHRALKHEHVLRCLGERTQGPLHYMFLEYAQGGELFDRIEPDVGMPVGLARRYWRQTLLGVAYLQARGVAHRDLKPENLLLDSGDNIKISDFGMATLYRHGGKERLLERVCGTLPYAAPEVLLASQRAYRAAPADLWAAAVVLLAMLAGELPWDRAHADCQSFSQWRAGRPAPRPWGKLGARPLALLRRALSADPAGRLTVEQLLKHPWMEEQEDDVDGKVEPEASWRGYCSQPAAPLSPASLPLAPPCFSQPAAMDDVLLATQDSRQTQQSQSVVQRLVRRMTRVWARVGEQQALEELAAALQRMHARWTRVHPNIFAIECGSGLKFRAWALRAGNEGSEPRVLLDFRRSRGCGLDFKRKFVEIRQALQHISAPPPPLHLDLVAPPLDSQDEPMEC